MFRLDGLLGRGNLEIWWSLDIPGRIVCTHGHVCGIEKYEQPVAHVVFFGKLQSCDLLVMLRAHIVRENG